MKRVFIKGRGLISPVGSSFEENCLALASKSVKFSKYRNMSIGNLSDSVCDKLDKLISDDKSLRHQARVTLLAVLASQEAMQEASSYSSNWGVVFGSSRGVTDKLESAIGEFLIGDRISASTSPITTANAIPSIIARYFKLNGMHFYVSGACSSSLHALGLGALLVRSGQFPGCIVGGAEDTSTAFVREMMKQTKVMSTELESKYPCRPMSPDRNGMVLSSGACALALDSKEAGALAELIGYGGATDEASLTGVSATGTGLQKAIHRALKDSGLQKTDVDLLVLHGSGTSKGDAAEMEAIQAVFGSSHIPKITFHKWLTGHMLGASAASSVAFAISHLNDDLPTARPFSGPFVETPQLGSELRNAMILSLGFGGNAGALIIRRL